MKNYLSNKSLIDRKLYTKNQNLIASKYENLGEINIIRKEI